MALSSGCVGRWLIQSIVEAGRIWGLLLWYAGHGFWWDAQSHVLERHTVDLREMRLIHRLIQRRFSGQRVQHGQLWRRAHVRIAGNRRESSDIVALASAK